MILVCNIDFSGMPDMVVWLESILDSRIMGEIQDDRYLCKPKFNIMFNSMKPDA